MSWIKSSCLIALISATLFLSWFERSFPLLLLSGSIFFVFILLASKNKPAYAVILSSLLASLAVADFLVGHILLGEETYFDPYGRKTYKTDIGRQPEPGIQFSRRIASDSGDVIYEASYTIGDDGFRVTPGNYEDEPRINLFGGSFAFGEGLNDDETLAFFLQEKFKSGVKNYGVHGYGMHQALAILQREDYPQGEANIFLTAPWHAPRSACKPYYAAGTPRYVLKDNTLERKGLCPQKAPQSAAGEVLEYSNTYKLIKTLTENSGYISNADIELYIALMRNIYEISANRNQTVTIAFIKAEEKHLSKSDYDNQQIARSLRKYSDYFVDVTLAEKPENLSTKYYIHELDQHPSTQANRRRSELIRSSTSAF